MRYSEQGTPDNQVTPKFLFLEQNTEYLELITQWTTCVASGRKGKRKKSYTEELKNYISIFQQNNISEETPLLANNIFF